MTTGMAICLTLCSGIALLHLALASAALNYHGAENYESLWFLLVGMPLFVVELVLSIVLFVRLHSRHRRTAALAAQIPLAVSTLIVVVVLGRFA